jgi:addiction module HigA family antidote
VEKFFLNGSKAGIQPKHAGKLHLQLFALDNAKHPSDMNALGWKLHPLAGTFKDHWAVSGRRKLALDVQVRRRGCRSRRLSGLSLKESFMRMHNPPHPGLVLREYLGETPVSAAAAHLRVTRVTLSRLLNGKAGISAAMALRLSAALGTSPELWMNMQSQYDLWRARQGRQPVVRKFAHVAEG